MTAKEIKGGHRSRIVIREGQTLKVYVDPKSGREFHSRHAMQAQIRIDKQYLMNNFERMVADRTWDGDPWERLPGESEVLFSRFREYLTMIREMSPAKVVGPKVTRSVRRLATRLGVADRQLTAASLKYHWNLRALCWDREMDRQLDEEFREEKKNAARKQARLGSKLQEAALRGAENILATGCVDMTPNDVARFADVGVKIERLAHDKSTSNEAQNTRTVFVYEGGKPKWADGSVEVVAEHQIETDQPPAGNQRSLVRQVRQIEGEVTGA